MLCISIDLKINKYQLDFFFKNFKFKQFNNKLNRI
jgi:hypothetical protein